MGSSRLWHCLRLPSFLMILTVFRSTHQGFYKICLHRDFSDASLTISRGDGIWGGSLQRWGAILHTACQEHRPSTCTVMGLTLTTWLRPACQTSPSSTFLTVVFRNKSLGIAHIKRWEVRFYCLELGAWLHFHTARTSPTDVPKPLLRHIEVFPFVPAAKAMPHDNLHKFPSTPPTIFFSINSSM